MEPKFDFTVRSACHVTSYILDSQHIVSAQPECVVRLPNRLL
jgi:hypothetical protein